MDYRSLCHQRMLFCALPLVVAMWVGTLSPAYGVFKLSQRPFDDITVEPPSGPSKGVLLVLRAKGELDHTFYEPARLSSLGFTVVWVDLAALGESAHPVSLQPKVIADALAKVAQALTAQDTRLAGKVPILLGAGDAALWVYEVLLASPPAQFHAGISINFCPPPDQISDGSIPAGGTGQGRQTSANWFVFQSHPPCDAKFAARFIDQTANARHVDVPDDTEALTTQLQALLNWLDPKIPDQLLSKATANDLPLTEMRSDHPVKSRFAVMLSGDGGWAAFDRGVSAELVRRGIDTVGWNSLNYFWKPKSPEQTARDLERVIQRYARDWQKTEVVLIGYSFGADVLPFVVDRLPLAVRARLRLIVLIGLSSNAAFEFHLSEWLGNPVVSDRWLTVPEIGRMTQRDQVICIYGSDETDSACPSAAKLGVTAARLKGDHHFGDNYQTIVDLIMENLK
ncbi:AcvB/VirJ family lysyl-phosphatidylglycerol hydrolase [Methyloterricola oryzae]|uniref:AcvB/VirJ family lysyl-phosphatidylglycerol hydrolase n=1 Tax=Methyloterricola oryzae TaxID=1495050 RepID=UPI0009E50F1A|nr:AcvB/VirJ family lysyl-phosphatidylglycerol hydrolase [Methyloterricola oryzae]